MNFAVVLLISCFFSRNLGTKSCAHSLELFSFIISVFRYSFTFECLGFVFFKFFLFFEMLGFWDSFGGHVLIVSPVTCGISIKYRTSREPPTQNKDIFQLLNALLSVELNVRHYASNFILFQLK